jgi:hypothetical protein
MIYLKFKGARNSDKNPIGFIENLTRSDFLLLLEEEYLEHLVDLELQNEYQKKRDDNSIKPSRFKKPSEIIHEIEGSKQKAVGPKSTFGKKLGELLERQRNNSRRLIRDNLNKRSSTKDRARYLDGISSQLSYYVNPITRLYKKSPYLVHFEDYIIAIRNTCVRQYPIEHVPVFDKRLERLVKKYREKRAAIRELSHTVIHDLKVIQDRSGVTVLEIKHDIDLLNSFKSMKFARYTEIKSPIRFFVKHGYISSAYYLIRKLSTLWNISESDIETQKLVSINNKPFRAGTAYVTLSRTDLSEIGLKDSLDTAISKHLREV